MPKYKAAALLVLRTRLNVNDPRNSASDEVKAHLRAIQHWLDTWVLPAVDCLDDGAAHWMREDVQQQARLIERREG